MEFAQVTVQSRREAPRPGRCVFLYWLADSWGGFLRAQLLPRGISRGLAREELPEGPVAAPAWAARQLRSKDRPGGPAPGLALPTPGVLG